MAENPTISANQYTIRQAILQPHMMTKGVASGHTRLDIAANITSIHLAEGIGQGVLSGHISIVDGSGLLENYPLRGEERLVLELEDAMKNVRVWDLFLYK